MGTKFLLNMSNTDIDWDISVSQTNPFDELKKYDVWRWSSEYISNGIIRKQCLRDTDLPEADEPILKIIKSNNYNPVFTNENTESEWGPSDCPNNQLGYKNSNPKKKKVCWYSSKDKTNTKTWIKKKRTGSKNDISLYHPNTYIDYKGLPGFKKYYPVGSIWSTSNDTAKPEDSECFPEISSSCASSSKTNMGPKKTTILVSGDVKSPLRYNKIWDNKDGCRNCQKASNHVTVWEPINPEGYTCLGDIVKKGGSEPDINSIKCIPNKCVTKKILGKKIWDASGMQEEHYPTSSSTTPSKIEKPKKVSIWASGINDIELDDKLRPDLKLKEDDGYNLFRSNYNNYKPSGDKAYTYMIKDNCINKRKVTQISPGNENLNILGKPGRNSKYSISSYLKRTSFGIIINNTSYDGKEKKYYIEHSGDNEDPNSYFIKGYNHEENNFSSCLTVSDKTIIRSNSCNKKNKSQIWRIIFVKDNDEKVKSEDGFYLIKLQSKSSDKYFLQKYNMTGILREILVDGYRNKGPHIWKFKSMMGDIE